MQGKCPYSQHTLPVTGDNSVMSLMSSFGRVLLRDPTEIIHAIGKASDGSDRTKISVLGHEFHILKHPDDIHAVFVEHAAQCPVSHAKSSASSYKPGATKLGNSSGDPAIWKEHRVAISHHVNAKGLRNNFDYAVENVLPDLANWGQTPRINVNDETTRIALKYAWAAFFTSELNDLEAEQLAELGGERLQKFFLLTFATLGKAPPQLIRTLSNVTAYTDALDAKIKEAIAQRLATPHDQWPTDFLSESIRKNHLDTSPFDPKIENQVLSELTEILVASYLNTRSAFYWSLHSLAQNPDLQERIRHETLDRGRVEQGVFSAATITAMETLRMYPPVYVLPRQTLSDITLNGNYEVSKGSHILIPTWNIHRDKRWYPDPDNFNPDMNFSPAAMMERPNHAYLPFGLGRHKCPGYAMAMQELTTLLSVVCTSYRIKPDERGVQPYLRAGTILNPEHESTLVLTQRPGASVHDAAKLMLDAA
jgi:cytochrome P450